MLPNANVFSDLCQKDQKQLLNYIDENFRIIKTINKKHTAYGLKARFNRLTGVNKKHHITSHCFMEAMVASGYKAIPVPDVNEPNWYFNIGEVYFND